MNITVQFDGVCEPTNPYGYGAYGLIIERDGIEMLREGVFVGQGQDMSNNVAEYSGVLRALEFLRQHGLNNESIVVVGDSKLVIEQLSKKWKIKHGIYKKLALRTRSMLKDFPRVIFRWTPRDRNEACDKLSKDVLKGMNVKLRIQPV